MNAAASGPAYAANCTLVIAEAKRRNVLIEEKYFTGALWRSDGGHVDPWGTTHAYAAGPKSPIPPRAGKDVGWSRIPVARGNNIAVGHNERIGFGFTIVGIDQADLYVERLKPEDPDEYLHKGQWLRMESEHDAIAVKGRREPVAVTPGSGANATLKIVSSNPKRSPVLASRFPVTYHHSCRNSWCGPWSRGNANVRGASTCANSLG